MCLRQRGKLVQGAGEDPLKRTSILTAGEGVAGRENSKQRGVCTTKALGIQSAAGLKDVCCRGLVAPNSTRKQSSFWLLWEEGMGWLTSSWSKGELRSTGQTDCHMVMEASQGNRG